MLLGLLRLFDLREARADDLAGVVQCLELMVVQLQLEDLLDALAAHKARYANRDVVLAVFPVQVGRERDDALLVVQDGCDDARNGAADADAR